MHTCKWGWRLGLGTKLEKVSTLSSWWGCHFWKKSATQCRENYRLVHLQELKQPSTILPVWWHCLFTSTLPATSLVSVPYIYRQPVQCTLIICCACGCRLTLWYGYVQALETSSRLAALQGLSIAWMFRSRMDWGTIRSAKYSQGI